MNSEFQIVGIGASAGGLEAFTQFLGNLDTNTGMAFVLVQHLDPNHPSQLSEILARETTMPVCEVQDGSIPMPNHVYVMPPNTRLTIINGNLKLNPRESEPASEYRPINEFLQSLAREHLVNAIGVVLSGTGSDGAQGLDDIRSYGGVTFAQNVDSAKFPGMPTAAIDHGVDFIMTPSQIAEELGKIARNSDFSDSEEELNPPEEKENELTGIRTILGLLGAQRKVNFLNYKSPTVQRRIQRRISLNRLSNTTEYLSLLNSNPPEVDLLFEDILVKVTSFFRNPDTFDALAKQVFPTLFTNAPEGSPVRFWIPGCSTGEEAYSYAIKLLEYMDDKNTTRKIEIFATDISEVALSKARAGCYDESIGAHVSAKRLSKFFQKENNTYRVGPRVRECCVFAKQDITIDPPFSRIDLISCRNLLIYLTPNIQKRILASFHFGLKPNGFLTLGNAETIGTATDIFGVTDSQHRIYFKKPGRVGSVVPDFVTNALSKKSATNQVYIPPLTESAKKSEIRFFADRAILDKIEPPVSLSVEIWKLLKSAGIHLHSL